MKLLMLTFDELSSRIGDFCKLYRSCFNGEITEKIVRNRYLGRSDKTLLMCVAEEDGRFVANYSALPVEVIINGEKKKAALSVNIMTHPAFAGRGLFTKLASKLSEHLEKEDYDLICCFPNLFSNKTLVNRLGWQDVYEFPTLELSVENAQQQTSFRVNMSDFSSLRLEYDRDKIYFSKDPEYLVRRYEKNPESKYVAACIDSKNWVVFKQYKDEMNMVELHGENVDNEAELVCFVVAEAKKKGAQRVTTWAHINTQTHCLLEKLGFVNKAPVRYFAVKQLSDCKADVYDHRLWRVSMGDDNVY